VGLLATLFFIPLPISRVRETGLVAVSPVASEGVPLPEPARLIALEVKPGEVVRKGQVLGRFKSEQLDLDIQKAQNQRDTQTQSVAELQKSVAKAKLQNDDTQKRYEVQMKEAQDKVISAAAELATLNKRRASIKELVAPCDGTVLTAPAPDEIGKLF